MKAVVCFFTGLGMLAIASLGILGQPPNQGNPDDGVEVQARGPIHEAFAQPTEPVQTAAELIAKKPPEPIDELPPEEKPDLEDVVWIPGYWAWDGDRDTFLWVSGIWRAPVPDRRWIPGYWQESGANWQWVSGFWGPIAETIEVYPTPPEPIEEAIAPPANADSTYVPGIWVYNEARFRWSPGHWIAIRPGWIWTPARYCWTPAGYCFVRGCWDYDFQHRGMIFAPVYIDVRIAQRPNWIYRPRHIVRTDFLLGSLFVNTSRHHYHFGDYYDVGYARRGFVPWVDYRVRRTSYDPLFSYYRWQNRAQPRWEADLRVVFTERRDNQNSRPPRTFAMQEQSKSKFTAVSTFQQARTSGVKLTTVSKTQVVEIQKQVAEVRQITTTRRTTETSFKATTKKSTTGAPMQLELPKTTFKAPVSKKTPPPLPVPVKIQDPTKVKAPKVDPPTDKLPKVDPPKDKLPKVDPPKDKLPKVDPPKEKLPKVDPPKEKQPKVDPPKEKLPKVDPPKEKQPKVDPPKEKPKKEKDKDKSSLDDLSNQPVVAARQISGFSCSATPLGRHRRAIPALC